MPTNEIHFCNFFTIDDVLVGKVTIYASLKKIHFPKISEQAPLKKINIFLKSQDKIGITKHFQSALDFQLHRFTEELKSGECFQKHHTKCFKYEYIINFSYLFWNC